MTSKGSKRIYKAIIEFESHFPKETLLKMYKKAARTNEIISETLPVPLGDDAIFKYAYYDPPHSHIVEPLFPKGHPWYVADWRKPLELKGEGERNGAR